MEGNVKESKLKQILSIPYICNERDYERSRNL